MKKMFPGYYRPTEGELRELWDKCIFVLDANVLLNLYRYSDETRKKLLGILKEIGPRLWVPHQAALEYQRNCLEVISKQRQAYAEIEQVLVDLQKKLEAAVRSYTRHPLIDAEKVISPIAAAFQKQAQELEKVRQQHPDLLDRDDVRDALTKLLEGRVGPPYSEADLKQIFKDGDERYAKLIPPGYLDAKSKPGDQKFGDLVLWRQALDKAAADKRPVLIVTDDAKEDWWWRHEGKTVGPKPELVAEMRAKAGVSFYMYRSDQFMEHAQKYLKHRVDQVAIEEVRAVRRSDEERDRERQLILRRQRQKLKELEAEQEVAENELQHSMQQRAALDAELRAILAAPSDSPDAGDRDRLLQELSIRKGHIDARISVISEARDELTRRLQEQFGNFAEFSSRHQMPSLQGHNTTVQEAAPARAFERLRYTRRRENDSTKGSTPLIAF